MKKEIRILGIDDGPFERIPGKKTLIVGTFYRGGQFMDGLVSCKVTIDGDDATEKIAKLAKTPKFYEQLHVIFIDGNCVAGFNVIDPYKLMELTKKPVVFILRDYPDYKKFWNAMRKAGKKKLINAVKKLPKPKKFKKIYYQAFGLKEHEAKGMITVSCTHSNIPEPIRVAHIIASGILTGVSTGKD